MTWMIWRYHDFRNLHICHLPIALSLILSDPFWLQKPHHESVTARLASSPRAAAGAPKACSTRGTLGATRRKLQWKQRSAWRLSDLRGGLVILLGLTEVPWGVLKFLRIFFCKHWRNRNCWRRTAWWQSKPSGDQCNAEKLWTFLADWSIHNYSVS